MRIYQEDLSFVSLRTHTFGVQIINWHYFLNLRKLFTPFKDFAHRKEMTYEDIKRK